jgi:DNA helicase HerA-like ATPase
MIEQPRSDTVSNLAAAALLIERARRIESEVINVGLPLLIDEAQRELDRSLPVR